MVEKQQPGRSRPFKRYPTTHILCYNVTTAAHYLLGGLGLIIGYESFRYGFLVGLAYIVFSFVQMYLIMPLAVCRNCSYFHIKGAVCVSGNNLISRRVAKPGRPKDFGKRAVGALSHNKLYMASLFLPVVLMAPMLWFDFSYPLLALLISVIGLLVFRMTILFRLVACCHCYMKTSCPNALAMGIR
jgi:uncharacterized membrane protein YccF (DUF307 family)